MKGDRKPPDWRDKHPVDRDPKARRMAFGPIIIAIFLAVLWAVYILMGIVVRAIQLLGGAQ